MVAEVGVGVGRCEATLIAGRGSVQAGDQVNQFPSHLKWVAVACGQSLNANPVGVLLVHDGIVFDHMPGGDPARITYPTPFAMGLRRTVVHSGEAVVSK